MTRKTEQEVHRTLEFLNETENIDFNPAFVDRICNRMVGIPKGRGRIYRGLLSYAIVVLILLILNVMTSIVLYEDRKPTDVSTKSFASIMADEYFSNQDVELTF